MGILDGILGPALTVATQAAGAHQQGQEQASKILQALRMQQASMDEKASVMRKNDADALATTHKNRAPVLGEPGYADAQGEVAGAEANAKVPAAVQQATQEAPIQQATHLANRKADVANPLPNESGHYTQTSGLGPDGKPVITVLDTRTGRVTPTNVGKPEASAGATGEINHARLAVAAGQARDADATMRAYEDKVLNGTAGMGMIDMAIAKQAMKGSVMAEQALATKNPELAAYVRAAKAISASERMITPRGGSNSLMAAEQVLASAGTGGAAGLIHQAQGWRSRLIRGLPADNAPQTAQDASAGRGQPGPSGDALDAKIAALKAQGLGPAEIKKQLMAEGYQ